MQDGAPQLSWPNPGYRVGYHILNTSKLPANGIETSAPGLETGALPWRIIYC